MKGYKSTLQKVDTIDSLLIDKKTQILNDLTTIRTALTRRLQRRYYRIYNYYHYYHDTPRFVCPISSKLLLKITMIGGLGKPRRYSRRPRLPLVASPTTINCCVNNVVSWDVNVLSDRRCMMHSYIARGGISSYYLVLSVATSCRTGGTAIGEQ